MSTTDKPTWLLAERFRDVPAIEEAITNFAHDQTGDNATGIVLAVLAHQAATEAAKPTAQDSAPAELPTLPEPLEIDWPTLNHNALGCGVEDRGIRDRYDAAAYGWQDGMDRAAERVPDAIYDADQMREYGQACATAALSRPVVAIPTEKQSLSLMALKFIEQIDKAMAAKGYSKQCRKDVITLMVDTKIEAPASPQPKAASEQKIVAWRYEWPTGSLIVNGDSPLDPKSEFYFDSIGENATATPLYASPQPVAKVLDDSEIKMIAYGHRIGTEVAVKFARAILEAASTPTTLTEKKE